MKSCLFSTDSHLSISYYVETLCKNNWLRSNESLARNHVHCPERVTNIPSSKFTYDGDRLTLLLNYLVSYMSGFIYHKTQDKLNTLWTLSLDASFLDIIVFSQNTPCCVDTSHPWLHDLDDGKHLAPMRLFGFYSQQEHKWRILLVWGEQSFIVDQVGGIQNSFSAFDRFDAMSCKMWTS